MLVAERLGLDLAPLLAGAGIAGIAIGFGAQSLVRDWISGLFMTLEDQYGVGDVVDVGPASGVVERMTLRATVLRGVDGTVWHVPNGQILRVGNRSQLWSVALLDVTVASGADLGRVRALLHDVATELCEREEFAPMVLEAPEVLGVEEMGLDTVTLRLTVKVSAGQPVHDPTSPPGGDQGSARSRRLGDPTTNRRGRRCRRPATISLRARRVSDVPVLLAVTTRPNTPALALAIGVARARLVGAAAGDVGGRATPAGAERQRAPESRPATGGWSRPPSSPCSPTTTPSRRRR